MVPKDWEGFHFALDKQGAVAKELDRERAKLDRLREKVRFVEEKIMYLEAMQNILEQSKEVEKYIDDVLAARESDQA